MMDKAHEQDMCLDEALIAFKEKEWEGRPAHAPDPLDEMLVEMIEKELGSEKAEWASSILHTKPDPDLVLAPGMWLRYPDDPPYIIRVEILKCGKKSSRVFQNGWTKPRVLSNRTLIRYRKTVPLTTDNPPKWIKKGRNSAIPYLACAGRSLLSKMACARPASDARACLPIGFWTSFWILERSRSEPCGNTLTTTRCSSRP